MQIFCTFVGKNTFIQHQCRLSFALEEEANSEFQSYFGRSRKLSLVSLWSNHFGASG